MQRVRIGLTGLACVFLLVVLAASIFGLATDPMGNVATNAVAMGQADRDAAPKEPLAELGVAPGNAPDATTNSTQRLPPIARR